MPTLNRIRLINLFFVFWALVLLVRLSYWQVVRAKDLSDQARNQHFKSETVDSVRGEILAEDGQPLVSNEVSFKLALNPKLLPQDTNPILSELMKLESSPSAIAAFTQPDFRTRSWLELPGLVPVTVKKHLESLKISGLYFEPGVVRIYPEGTASAHLTGFVGKDDLGRPKGYFGLEGYYDRELKGKSGKITEEKDVYGRPISLGEQNIIPGLPGRNLVTSIDRTVQYTISDKLARGVEKYAAKGGSVVVMESATGNILGMANLPGYDPLRYQQSDTSVFKNPIVSDSYEPGSTFKPLVMAAALNFGNLKITDKCSLCAGPLVIGDHAVSSWNSVYYPNSSLEDIILHSDNVGMVFVGRSLGREKLLAAVKNFGFGKPTGIDLQEENSPGLRPDNQWQELDWSTVSFGQGIAVTRLQMVTAINSLANGGQLLSPRIVTHLESPEGRTPVSRPQPRPVVSPAVAAAVVRMMVRGVDQGEVRYYKPKGYLVAGKTGTAQVAIEGHYDQGQSITSFVGFAPADNPKFTMLVTLTDPQKGQWGSTTAAPVWFDIAKELLRYYKIPAR